MLPESGATALPDSENRLLGVVGSVETHIFDAAGGALFSVGMVGA